MSCLFTVNRGADIHSSWRQEHLLGFIQLLWTVHLTFPVSLSRRNKRTVFQPQCQFSRMTLKTFFEGIATNLILGLGFSAWTSFVSSYLDASQQLPCSQGQLSLWRCTAPLFLEVSMFKEQLWETRVEFSTVHLWQLKFILQRLLFGWKQMAHKHALYFWTVPDLNNLVSNLCNATQSHLPHPIPLPIPTLDSEIASVFFPVTFGSTSSIFFALTSLSHARCCSL